MPPLGNPELALVLAGVPDSLVQTGGDLYAVIVDVAGPPRGTPYRKQQFHA